MVQISLFFGFTCKISGKSTQKKATNHRLSPEKQADLKQLPSFEVKIILASASMTLHSQFANPCLPDIQPLVEMIDMESSS
ncbi:MAG: hypothetical protein PHW41_05380 [Eubacteriales bacterium]|nr:hypothetical protein [Eubacteriales bacterium]